jgi:flagellar basal-body rod modification protein FlgD
MQPVAIDPSSYRPVAEANPFITEKPTVGKNEFMRLLVAQLENQNPLEPAKDTEFVAQLATFSSLEQLVDLNKRMDGVLGAQNDLVNSQALDLIGRKVLADVGGVTNLKAGKSQELVYQLPVSMASAKVEIVDSAGKVVTTFSPTDGATAGEHRVDWDGKDSNGTVLPDGKYTARVVVSDGKTEVTLKPFTLVPVDGVRFGADGLSLVSGDQAIPFASIVEIRNGE